MGARWCVRFYRNQPISRLDDQSTLCRRRVLQVHASGKQPGVLLSQLCNVIEAFQADNRGRWTATVTGHRRVQVTGENDLPNIIASSNYDREYLRLSGRHVQQK